MTNSKSRVSRSKPLLVALAAVAVLAVLGLCTGLASAGRKRLVVLDFEGDGAAKVQAGVVALLKKHHTVISAAKWNDAASDLSAESVSEKNIKKVAKKLKIDGVVSGQVEKRRGDYIIRVKLRAGTTGEIVGGQINVKSSSAKLDDSAESDLADELIGPVGDLDTNRGGGGGGGGDDDGDADEKPVKKVKPSKVKPPVEEEDEEEDEDEDELEDAKPKKGFSRRKAEAAKPAKPAKKVAKAAEAEAEDEDEAEAEDEDDENPLPKKRPAKQADADDDEVAAREDDESGGELEESDDSDRGTRNPKALTPQERAVDAVAGLSFTMRRLGFNFSSNVTTEPNGYKSIPLPGVKIDATIYPGAIGHKRGGIAENIGATVLFDKVLLISSQDMTGAKLKTSQQRWAVGVVARYPLKKAVLGATLAYGKQLFSIEGDTGVPDTAYSVIHPGLFVRYPATPKILVNVAAGALAVMGTGQIQEDTQYGGASVLGIDFQASADYQWKENIFLRGGMSLQTYGFAFSGNGDRTMGTGGQAVAGARDTYVGFALNLGYLY